MTYVEPLMRRNFLEYASYVVVDRAIPDLRDGCKPVQRRLLHTLYTMDDGRFNKVANVIGETMKLHPHGDASIGDALVVLANKEYFIERQGNFGNIYTGHAAAAARYIECRLTPLARETLFNPNLTEFMPSYDGRRQEPVALPAKVPVVLMLGTEGIAVGMATHILPHNFIELLKAEIAILQDKSFKILPDFQQGGIMDASDYQKGRGSVRARARLESDLEGKTVVVRELPYGMTTESLIAAIEAAAQKGKVKIAGIEDRTAEQVEIVIRLPRGVYSAEVIPQLYAYGGCEQVIHSNLTVVDKRRPSETTVNEVLEFHAKELKRIIKLELEYERQKLQDKQHYLTLEQIFVEKRVYKRIEEAKTEEAVRNEVFTGMRLHKKLWAREMVDEDVARLLAIPIRRISAYDIEKNRKEIADTVEGVKNCERKLKQLTKTAIQYLEALIKKYGPIYPRRTEIDTFEVVDKRAVARQHLKVSYDPEGGFFGTAVRGSEYKLSVSEFDKILIVSRDGSYRILVAPEKVLISDRILYCELFDETKGQIFTLIYRDKKKGSWAKKVKIERFIREREYELIRNKQGRIDWLHVGELKAKVHLDFAPAKGQRVHEGEFDLAPLEFSSISARGTKIAPRAVAKVRLPEK